MKKLKENLKLKLQHDENLILKVIGEIGDLVRIMRNMEARLEKLEKKWNTR